MLDPPCGPPLILGATSMVGGSVIRRAPATAVGGYARRSPFRGPPHWARLDLERRGEIASVLDTLKPATVIHCGGICDVEKCEENPAWAFELNVGGTQRLLEHLDPRVRLVYVSSDHVFGGGGPSPFDEQSEPQPITAYGRTRIAAEQEVLRARPDALVVRVGLPIGPSLTGRTGHLDWLKRRHSMGLPMTVIDDELRAAVAAVDMADRIVALAKSRRRGVQHIAATQIVDRPSLAEHLAQKIGIRPTLGIQSRADQKVAHLGRVELSTMHRDPLASPLPAAHLCDHALLPFGTLGVPSPTPHPPGKG